MSAAQTVDFKEKYVEQGYNVLSFSDRTTIADLRAKCVRQFDRLSLQHGAGPVVDDSNIESLYRSRHRDLWVGAVDQLPFLPEIMALSGNADLLKVAGTCGIREPALAGVAPTMLANMPNDGDFLYAAHQDIAFLPGSLNSVTIWIPLQDSPNEIGPLEVIPGSHREGLLARNEATDVKKSKLIPPRSESDFVPIPLVAGEAIAFSSFIIHRSGCNRSRTIRFSVQVRFNDLASPEYASRKFTFDHLVPEAAPEYSFEA